MLAKAATQLLAKTQFDGSFFTINVATAFEPINVKNVIISVLNNFINNFVNFIKSLLLALFCLDNQNCFCSHFIVLRALICPDNMSSTGPESAR